MSTLYNRRSARQLSTILDEREWNSGYLAKRARLPASVVSTHVSGQRRILTHHLALYLQVLDSHERALLLYAWLRDNLDPAVVDGLLAPRGEPGRRIAATVTDLEPEHREMLDWFADLISRNGEISDHFEGLVKRLGYGKPH